VGAHPRIAACSTVGFYWLRLFRETKGKNYAADVKKLLPTLDIGSHINATLQAPPIAEARNEHRLLAVACRPMLGLEVGSAHYSCTPAFYFRTDQCCSVTEVSVRISVVLTYGTNSTALFTA
jgi:hypothetical protein